MNKFLSITLSIISFLCFALPLVAIVVYVTAGEEGNAFFSFMSIFPFWLVGSWLIDKSLEVEYNGLTLPRYSNRKVGGIRFIRMGRFTFSFSVSKGKKKQVRVSPTPAQEVLNSGVMLFPMGGQNAG
jgi:hypothetical protein